MKEPLSHHYLDRTAMLWPQQTAITDGRAALTFGELASLTDRLGCLLAGLGVARGDRVAYLLKRSIECLVATVGTLKSGASYVPLDQRAPAPRWQRILRDAEPRAIICNSATLEAILEGVAALDFVPAVVCLDPRPPGHEALAPVVFREEIQAAAGAPPSGGSPDDPAYVLYTSGSTGAPKGVVITHANIRNYIDWAAGYFGITAEDRILGTAPFYFDMSTFDVFCSLATGATLCLATEELLLFPENLVRFMEREKVTLWKGVSSLLMYLSRAGVLRPGRMPTLRTVIFAGEPLNAQYLARWMEIFPEKRFYNGYGPTEATGISLCYRVDRIPELGQPIPIGRPVKGALVVLLGDNGTPVCGDEVGELCIAGPGLATGYLNDIEKTQCAFTPPPAWCAGLGDRIYHSGDLARQLPSGDYVFVARKDHQIKWMGYRIELSEIEANLLAHPQIRDAAVVLAAASESDLLELVAFYEADGELAPTSLAPFLRLRLPPYMMPRRFVRVARMPRNDRGKIARDELLDRDLRPIEAGHARVA
jgi:amino acid adenylation domain-containing protein